MTGHRTVVVDWLTAAVVIAWVGTLVARAIIPSFSGGAADTGMLLVVGWWFTIQTHRNNGS